MDTLQIGADFCPRIADLELVDAAENGREGVRRVPVVKFGDGGVHSHLAELAERRHVGAENRVIGGILVLNAVGIEEEDRNVGVGAVELVTRLPELGGF